MNAGCQLDRGLGIVMQLTERSPITAAAGVDVRLVRQFSMRPASMSRMFSRSAARSSSGISSPPGLAAQGLGVVAGPVAMAPVRQFECPSGRTREMPMAEFFHEPPIAEVGSARSRRAF